MDLKSAFDTVNRDKLWQIMEKHSLGKKLIIRIKELYKETACKIEVDEKQSNIFWTNKGLRQGCPLSPLLFAIYIADYEKILREAQDGGIMVGRTKVHTLAYADDMVIMAETATQMKEMMKTTNKYLTCRNLKLNSEKFKVVVFRKGSKEGKREEWKRNNESIEEVEGFEYFGYLFNRNNNPTRHIKGVYS